MKLVKCRKCGTAVMTDDTLLESMIGTMNELNKLAIKDKSNRPAYQQQVKQLTKMINQVMHRTSAIEMRKCLQSEKLSVLIHYLFENNLITMEKLDEIEIIAKERVKKKNAEDEAAIEALYGAYKSDFTFNKTKSDPTANRAIR